MKKLFVTLLLLASTQSVFAHAYLEKQYQEYWARLTGAQTEVVLDDKTRVDCLTKTYAVEVDFAQKWAESIGQSLYYGIKTCKKPAVLLIIENPEKDTKYLKRLNTVATKYGITVFTVTKEDLEGCRK